MIVEILSILAVAINVITLIIVLVQTLLTRRAVKLAEDTFRDARKGLHLERLPEAGTVIHVMVKIERWIEELQEIAGLVERIPREGKVDLVRALSVRGLRLPSGLVHRRVYEACPPWFQQLYISGAQHYYDVKCAITHYWDPEKETPRFSAEHDLGATDTFVRKCKERSYCLNLMVRSN